MDILWLCSFRHGHFLLASQQVAGEVFKQSWQKTEDIISLSPIFLFFFSITANSSYPSVSFLHPLLVALNGHPLTSSSILGIINPSCSLFSRGMSSTQLFLTWRTDLGPPEPRSISSFPLLVVQVSLSSITPINMLSLTLIIFKERDFIPASKDMATMIGALLVSLVDSDLIGLEWSGFDPQIHSIRRIGGGAPGLQYHSRSIIYYK